MTYWLSIVKFVPDPAKGEFINVGAIAGSDDSQEWMVRSVGSWARAKKLDDRETVGAVTNFIGRLEMQIDLTQEGKLEPSQEFTLNKLRDLSDEMNNIVQITTPIPVALSSVSDVLDLAFRELIVDPQSRRRGYLTKHAAVRDISAAYRARGVPNYRGARVRSGPYDTEFDFAVANGRTVQLVKCWSYQLQDQSALADELKAWAWGVRELRRSSDARTVVENARTLPVNGETVDVEVVFVPPTEGQVDTRAVDVANKVFEEIGVHAHPSRDAIYVAQEAEARLSAPH